MTPDPKPDWKDLLKNIAWYVWLALAPLIKAYLLRLDSGATSHADRDPTNPLHKQP